MPLAFADHPLIGFSTKLFDENMANLGVLRKDLIEKFVFFYGQIDFLNSFQSTKQIYASQNKIDVFNCMYKESLDYFLTWTEKNFPNSTL